MFFAIQVLLGAMFIGSLVSFGLYLYWEWKIERDMAIQDAIKQDHKSRAYRAQ